jgi:uncharacterized protein
MGEPVCGSARHGSRCSCFSGLEFELLPGSSLMNKLLLFLVLLYVIYRLRRWLLSKPGRQPSVPVQTDRGEAEPFQACARCGLLLPESEGVRLDGRFFCSAEHSRMEAE